MLLPVLIVVVVVDVVVVDPGFGRWGAKQGWGSKGSKELLSKRGNNDLYYLQSLLARLPKWVVLNKRESLVLTT
jgi:hypothetical protein